MHSGYQVGFTLTAAGRHASIWSGTAASWEDLSLALTGSWEYSFANDIWADDTTQYVVGYGLNNSTGIVEALLWTRPIPTPGAAILLAFSGIAVARRRR